MPPSAVVVVATLVVIVVGLPASRIQHLRTERVTRGVRAVGNPVGDLYFCRQKQDHFDHSNHNEWCQRYFANLSHWKGEGHPVFLCVGGEGPPLDSTVVQSSLHCDDMLELAPKVGAALFAVEHRYYGRSIPHVDDFSTPNLKFLRSQQALADLATFHAFATQNYSLGVGAKWVTFGGSYPGMLASFARLLYPNLFYAAVSSSAPVKAQLNFRGYLEVAAATLALPAVGGSIECVATISDGHKRLRFELSKSARARRAIEKRFNLCGDRVLDDPDSVALWAGSGVIPFDLQGNDPTCATELCNVEKICRAVEREVSKGTDSLEVLAIVAGRLSSSYKCTDVSYDGYMKDLENVTLEGGTGRVWMYQTCNEFGFYQTCEEDSNCPYTKGGNTLDFNLKQCATAFNISSQQVLSNVASTNAFYGADQPNSTRVLFANGQEDPWHYLSVLVTPGPHLPTLWVPGASHHYWTHPSSPNDSIEVARARAAIWSQVIDWLGIKLSSHETQSLSDFVV